MDLIRQRLENTTILFLGGTSGIGLAAAKMAAYYGARPILVGRNADKLSEAAAQFSNARTALLDVTDESTLEVFFQSLGKVDHIFATHSGPYYARLHKIDFEKVRQNFHDRFVSMLAIARFGKEHINHGGSITFMGGTTSRKPGPSYSITGPLNDAVETLTKGLAIELAPVRVNIIPAGFVNTQLSKSILKDRYEARIMELEQTLPIGRIVEPEDVAMLAIQLMANGAVTGGVFDIDGGQNIVQ